MKKLAKNGLICLTSLCNTSKNVIQKTCHAFHCPLQFIFDTLDLGKMDFFKQGLSNKLVKFTSFVLFSGH